MRIAQSVVVAVGVLALGGCPRPGWVTRTEELGAGECARVELKAGETCTRQHRDRNVSASATVPLDDRSGPGGRAAFHWSALEAALDVRGVTRAIEPRKYPSIALGVGLHVGVLQFSSLYRHLDIGVDGGFGLGVIKFGRVIRGRGDAYFGAYAEVAVPDFSSLRYFDRGVPALHVGVRRIAYVQGWQSAVTVELGLVWRWGREFDLHKYKYYRMMVD